jgi:uncharacterized protein YecT (DUF1311 family)
MIRQARPMLAMLLVFTAGAAAMAQGGPSFDCAKADNAIDRTICKDPELAKADREMAAAYAALVGKLRGAAKDEAIKDQVRWIGDRNRACLSDTDGMAACLKDRYGRRTSNLRAFADGTYPFIGGHALIKRGTLGKIDWSYDIVYPQFDGPTSDFVAINARFADAAKKKAADATPGADARPDLKQQWTYEQSFAVKRPSADVVSIAVDFSGYSGGAHGYGATHCTLVDLNTGKALGPQAVFAPGEQWLRVMSQIVGADLKKQFVDKPGFDDALQPANLAKLLSESGRYCWTAKGLEVVFNAYDVGPYASGPYEVDIPYDRLKPILRADGPISR